MGTVANARGSRHGQRLEGSRAKLGFDLGFLPTLARETTLTLRPHAITTRVHPHTRCGAICLHRDLTSCDPHLGGLAIHELALFGTCGARHRRRASGSLHKLLQKLYAAKTTPSARGTKTLSSDFI